MRLFIISLILFTMADLSAQSVNMVVSGNFAPNNIPVGTNSVLMVTMTKQSIGQNINPNGLSVEIKWGEGYLGNTTPTGTWANLFSWTYIPPPGYTFGGWYGINNAVISDFAGVVNFTVTGTTQITNSSTQVQVQLNTPYSDPVPGDNNIFAGLTVLAPLPIDLLSFEVKNGKCGESIIEWATVSEINSNFIDLERSDDGINFKTVYNVKTLNASSSGNKYSYSDSELAAGAAYYYRLHQVDLDGRSTYFDTKKIITNDCAGGQKLISLYPNPAFEKIFVSLTGMNDTKNVNLVISNAIGVNVLTIPNVSTKSANEIKLNSLPAGIYNINIVGYDEVTSKRFIKVD